MTNAPESGRELPKPCACNAKLIGMSDGSSVHGWKCSRCDHVWPVNRTAAGMARLNYAMRGGMYGGEESFQQLLRDLDAAKPACLAPSQEQGDE